MSKTKIISANDGIAFYDSISDASKEDTFIRSEMQVEVANYWAGHTERRFIIPFWKAKKLIQSSNIKQVAIKLTQYTEPAEVDGEWVSFNADVPSGNTDDDKIIAISEGILKVVANIKEKEEIIYFTFGESLIAAFEEGFDLIDPPPPPPEQKRTITARIGKVVNNLDDGTIEEIIGVFFILGEVKLHLNFAGVAGIGASCGAKIPPPIKK